jgi:hypothetical protein
MFLHGVRSGPGTHKASCPMETDASFRVVKRAEPETNGPRFPFNILLHGVCLVNHRDNFTLRWIWGPHSGSYDYCRLVGSPDANGRIRGIS